jgi:hypothetical protein
LERYLASNDPNFEDKAADIIGLYLTHRNTPPFAASMRRPRFKRSIGWTLFCRCHQVVPNDMVLDTIATAHCPCMRHST